MEVIDKFPFPMHEIMGNYEKMPQSLQEFDRNLIYFCWFLSLLQINFEQEAWKNQLMF